MSLPFSHWETVDFAALAVIVLLLTAGRAFLVSRRPDHSRRLEQKLDALLEHHGIELPPGLSPDVQALARNPTRKIEAIRLHREDHPGLGLAEAKAQVEEVIQSRT